MSENNDAKLWCLILSTIIISFVVGYATGFFVFHEPLKVILPHKTIVYPKILQMDPDVNKSVPGSERFYNSIDTIHQESEDHDSQIIKRMKK